MSLVEKLSKEDGRIILKALRYAKAMAYGFNFPATQGEVYAVIKKIEAMMKE